MVVWLTAGTTGRFFQSSGPRVGDGRIVSVVVGSCVGVGAVTGGTEARLEANWLDDSNGK